ncbi:hypothetical protein GDO86_006908 [Hymenochirus boettgeri]|uniref:Hexosyltransferase n=1 Tax=Hymenochirus boettgeri TaxID=247094 RepID=A0A8T2JDI1_9PIPI|nr:hypothetical protein GDO86_006908 [Hymenochirus boettgeri]
MVLIGQRGFWRYCKVAFLCISSFIGFTFLIKTRTHILQASSGLNYQTELPAQDRKVSLKHPPITRHPMIAPYPYPYKFLMNPQEKCQGRTPFLVLLVVAESHDIESRMAIRETWGNESNYGEVDMVTVFLVGLSKVATDKVNLLLEEENRIYGDIVQQDFIDTYYNLTLKTLMGMEWVAKYCPTASYVMKIDSDMFLNVEYLVHKVLVKGTPVRQNYITGHIYFHTGPIRDKAYKWYVPKEVYPNNTYPPYCSGPGYVFSADLAQKIFDMAQVIRLMPMEDSFIGICLYELKLSPSASPPNTFLVYRRDYDRCAFNKLVIVHHYARKELREVWDDFWTKKHLGC